MKITAFFLAIFVNFLLFQPASVEIAPANTKKTSQSCCTQKKATQKKGCKMPSEKNKCTAGVCNPFAECCFFISYLPIHSFFLFDLTKEKINTTTARLVHNYAADCFHPPEL